MLSLFQEIIRDTLACFSMTDLATPPNPLPLYSNSEPNLFPRSGPPNSSRFIFFLQLIHHSCGFIGCFIVFLVFFIVMGCLPLEATLGLPWKAWLIPAATGLGSWWFGRNAKVRWGMLFRWRRVKRERARRAKNADGGWEKGEVVQQRVEVDEKAGGEEQKEQKD
ncbi:hypothetical protein BDY24DRAFT_381384 [Mrakia frigida]|uniref:uncharacterized protein n=1 Tax=Mrakia frigida TaxID=29902 RepID=UPI003FCBF159